MLNDIYKECPTYLSETISLRKTSLEDASDLLKCYSDEKAVSLFNSDNCHGDDFHYATIEKMKEAIDFWNFSYDHTYFIRFTIILNSTKEKIGTIEMFKRESEDEFNDLGVLRLDLQSKYEKEQYIDEILELVSNNFYKAFDVDSIITKAIPNATERISSLKRSGYIPLGKKFLIYGDYFVKNIQNLQHL